MFNKWILLGDCHGNITKFKNLAQIYNPKETAVIQLGDLGCNYYLNSSDKKLKYKLNKIGFTIYVVRGNHEARPSTLPSMVALYDSNVDGQILYEPEFPNIRYFLDGGGNYTINGYKCLVVPGAYSVDKEYRLLHGYNWFADEQLTSSEKECLEYELHSSYDFVLSHTCPLSFQNYISDLFLTFLDQSKIDNSTELYLEKIFNNFTYVRSYFGHYHDDRDIDICKATMLYNEYIELGDTLKDKWRKMYNEK